MKTGRLWTALFALLAGTLMLFVVPWGFGASAAPGSTATHSPITADTCGSGWVTANDAGSGSPFSLPGLSVTSGDTVVAWVAAIETGVFLGAPSAAGWTFSNALEWSVNAGQRGIAAWYGTAPATACVVFTISGSAGIGRTAIVEDIGHTLGLEASNNATTYGSANTLPLTLTTGHTNDVIEAAAIAGSGTDTGYSPGTQIGAGTSVYSEWMQTGYLSTGSAGSYTITADYSSGGDAVWGAVVFEDAPAVSAGNLTITAIGRTTAAFSWTNPPGTDNEVIWIYPSASAGAATCSGVQVTTSSVGVSTAGSVIGLSPGTNYSAEVQTQTAEGTAATGCIWFQTSQAPYAEYVDAIMQAPIGCGYASSAPAPGNDVFVLYGCANGTDPISLLNLPAQTKTVLWVSRTAFDGLDAYDAQLASNGTMVYLSAYNTSSGNFMVVSIHDASNVLSVTATNALAMSGIDTSGTPTFISYATGTHFYLGITESIANDSSPLVAYALSSFTRQAVVWFYATSGANAFTFQQLSGDFQNISVIADELAPGHAFIDTYNTTTMVRAQSVEQVSGGIQTFQYLGAVLYAIAGSDEMVFVNGGAFTVVPNTGWVASVFNNVKTLIESLTFVNNTYQIFANDAPVNIGISPGAVYYTVTVHSRDSNARNATFFLGNGSEEGPVTAAESGVYDYWPSSCSDVTNCSTLIAVNVPPPPTNLHEHDSNTVLTWTQATGGGITANTLRVFSGTSCSVIPLFSLYLSPAVTTDTFTNLTVGAHYTFDVSAWNATGEGAYSACYAFVATSVPPAPTDLSVASLQTTSGILTWVQSTGGGILNDTALVWANSDCSGSPAFVYSTHGAATTYLDTNLTAQTTFSFEVASWNATGESPRSSCFPFTTPTGDPSLVFEDVTTNSFFEYWGNGTWLNVTGPVYIVFGLTQGAVQNASVSWPSRDNTNGILGVWSWTALTASGEAANNSVVTYYYNASSTLNESFGPGWSVWIGLLIEVSHTTWFVFSVQLVIFSHIVPPPGPACPIICWLILVFVTAPLAATYLYFAVQRRWPWQSGYFYKVRRNPNWGRRGRL